MSPILIPIFSIVFGVLMIIFIRRFIHIERLNMIERGMNPSDIRSVWRQRDPYRHLRYACTAIGIGAGFLSAGIYTNGRHNQEEIYIGMITLLGGMGLLIGYALQYYLQNKDRKEGRNQYEGEL
jgi:uncharacterized membrane protein YfcA